MISTEIDEIREVTDAGHRIPEYARQSDRAHEEGPRELDR